MKNTVQYFRLLCTARETQKNLKRKALEHFMATFHTHFALLEKTFPLACTQSVVQQPWKRDQAVSGFPLSILSFIFPSTALQISLYSTSFSFCDGGISTSLGSLQVGCAALNNRFDSKCSEIGVNNERLGLLLGAPASSFLNNWSRRTWTETEMHLPSTVVGKKSFKQAEGEHCFLLFIRRG